MNEQNKNDIEIERNIEKLASLIDGDPYYVGIILLAMTMKSNGIEPFEFLEDEC